MTGDSTGIINDPLERFVAIAISQKGYRERDDNITKYGEWYGINPGQWCAMFVSWSAGQSGLLGTVVPKYHNCLMGAQEYMAQGRYETSTSGYEPKAGDTAFFYSKANGRIGHTGIVVAYDPATNIVYVIEGNVGNIVDLRKYDLDTRSEYLVGFGVNGGDSFGTIPTDIPLNNSNRII